VWAKIDDRFVDSTVGRLAGGAVRVVMTKGVARVLMSAGNGRRDRGRKLLFQKRQVVDVDAVVFRCGPRTDARDRQESSRRRDEKHAAARQGGVSSDEWLTSVFGVSVTPKRLLHESGGPLPC